MANNTILIDQNQAPMIRLLKAKWVAYNDAKNIQYLEWLSQLFSIATPVFVILSIPNFSEKYSLIVTSVLLIASAITYITAKKRTNDGVNIQEEFDTEIFKLNWNETLCGDKVPTNDVINFSKRFKAKDKQEDWYSKYIVPQIRHVNAVLLCQDSNLVWDRDLRKKFVSAFTISCIIYYVIIITYLMYKNYSVNHSLAIIAPTFSFALFSVMNIINIQEIIDEKKKLSQQVNSEFIKFRSTRQEISYHKLREIQDMIYSTRKRPEKIPNWFYKIFKAEQENTMDECTRENIRKYDLLR